MQSIERIRAALKDATPGPWIVGKYGRGTTIATVCHVSEFSVGPEDDRYDNHGACKDDADYIAACNPAALSEVLAHIDKLEAEVERLKDLADSEGSRAVGYLRRARNAKAENERLNAIANSEGTRAAEYLRRARNVEDEAERLRKDAERYQFLRAQRIDGAPGIPVTAVPNGMRSGYYMNEENADYAVDTAMKGTP